MIQNSLRLLFILNSGSGNNSINWVAEIEKYFTSSKHIIELYVLTKDCNIETIKEKIKLFSPQKVVAVGGDGTIKLVAECIIQTKIMLGILPAGSANGLAKELGISNNPTEALDIIVNGLTKKIHLISINDELCIHLSDIGLNAYAMKKFENQKIRGWWGYLMASWKVLWQNPLMEVSMEIDGEMIKMKAAIIIIANATKYGTGAIINPIGKLDDKLFEVIVIKKIIISEILKVIFTHNSYDSEKTQIFQTNALLMKSKKKVHFQIDGEYLGKVNEVKAVLMPKALEIIVPNV